jgi:hypothetical protein
MAHRILVASCLVLSALAAIQAQAVKPVRVAFAGTSGLTAPFVDSLRSAGAQAGLDVEVVPRADSHLVARDVYLRVRAGQRTALAPDEGRNYFLVVLTQAGQLANVAVVLDRDGEVVASVVHYGPFFATGARDSSAKELAQKLAGLVR